MFDTRLIAGQFQAQMACLAKLGGRNQQRRRQALVARRPKRDQCTLPQSHDADAAGIHIGMRAQPAHGTVMRLQPFLDGGPEFQGRSVGQGPMGDIGGVRLEPSVAPQGCQSDEAGSSQGGCEYFEIKAVFPAPLIALFAQIRIMMKDQPWMLAGPFGEGE